jgi:hypothetical protein
MRDTSAIQRLVAERHGAQRARLGWGEDELRREFAVLREELAAAVRRRAPAQLRGPTADARAGDAERALEVIDEFVGVAEAFSLTSFRRYARTGDAAATR